jgi:hypothetical protein
MSYMKRTEGRPLGKLYENVIKRTANAYTLFSFSNGRPLQSALEFQRNLVSWPLQGFVDSASEHCSGRHSRAGGNPESDYDAVKRADEK